MKRPGRMLKEAISHVWKKPATVRYPFVKSQVPPRFRGKLNFSSGSCIGCKICMKDCPSRAIDIRKVGDKRFECEVDLSKCIYCGQCQDSCPKKSIEMSSEFELAALTRGTLKVVFHAPELKLQPEGQPAAARPAGSNGVAKHAPAAGEPGKAPESKAP